MLMMMMINFDKTIFIAEWIVKLVKTEWLMREQHNEKRPLAQDVHTTDIHQFIGIMKAMTS